MDKHEWAGFYRDLGISLLLRYTTGVPRQQVTSEAAMSCTLNKEVLYTSVLLSDKNQVLERGTQLSHPTSPTNCKGKGKTVPVLNKAI
jgi:hypothetical protein